MLSGVRGYGQGLCLRGQNVPAPRGVQGEKDPNFYPPSQFTQLQLHSDRALFELYVHHLSILKYQIIIIIIVVIIISALRVYCAGALQGAHVTLYTHCYYFFYFFSLHAIILWTSERKGVWYAVVTYQITSI